MNCPSCNRPNKDGLVHCDYCGTPLSTPASPKRKTEAEVPHFVPSPGAPKRVTEIEAPTPNRSAAAAEPDPFNPAYASDQGGGGSGFDKPGRGNVEGGSRKRVTAYDSADPFQVRSDSNARRADGGGAGPEASPNQGRRIVGWLITFDGNADGSSHLIREGRNIIGRNGDCDIVTPADQRVSGVHAYLIWRAGRARIADANTVNGTFLNEEDVLGQVEVKDNDVIRVGHVRFVVRLLDVEKISALFKQPVRGA